MLKFVCILVIVFAALAAVDVVIAVHFFNKSALRRKSSLKQTQSLTGVCWEKYDPRRITMIERLKSLSGEDYYITSKDGTTLHARYIESDALRRGAERKIVICFHGYTSRCIGNNTAIATFFLDNGFDVLLPDLRAHGESGGRYFGFGILDRYDGLEWVNFLCNMHSESVKQGLLSIYLYGVSMGGATVCMMSGLEMPNCVKAVISDCAFTSPRRLFKRLLKTKYGLPPALIMPAANLIYRLRAGYGLEDSASDTAAGKSKLPMLFFHGESDGFIPAEMCREIYEACGSDKKEMVLIKSSDHAEAYFADTELYERKIKEFLEL